MSNGLVVNDVNVSISRAIVVVERNVKYSVVVCAAGGLPGNDEGDEQLVVAGTGLVNV